MTKSRSYLVPLILVVVVVLAGAAYFLPLLWAKGVPGYINQHVSPLIVIESASFSHSPPELILNKVHLKNPAAFGEGDAIIMDRINVVFEGYSRNPTHIRSIVVNDVKSRYIVRGNTDNFSALRQEMTIRKNQVARGQLAKSVMTDSIFMGPSTMQNEDGSIARAIPATEINFTNNPSSLPNGQRVIAGVMDLIIQQEQKGILGAKVEGFKEKAEETIRSIGQAIRDYVTQPAEPE